MSSLKVDLNYLEIQTLEEFYLDQQKKYGEFFAVKNKNILEVKHGLYRPLLQEMKRRWSFFFNKMLDAWDQIRERENSNVLDIVESIELEPYEIAILLDYYNRAIAHPTEIGERESIRKKMRTRITEIREWYQAAYPEEKTEKKTGMYQEVFNSW